MAVHPAPLPEEEYSSLSCVWGGERENRFGCLGFIGHKGFSHYASRTV